jgi:glycosyltransferase involved in cell wall biosynthesis
VRFELGLSSGLDELYRQARAVVSTSVKEGFGLSFLEPLARGKPVLGRRLPAVIDDFEEGGLHFSDLYRSITVPERLFDRPGFLHRTGQVLAAAYGVYGLKAEALPAAVLSTFAADPDFGRLDETAQAEVLGCLAETPAAKAEFLAANPFLAHWWEPKAQPSDRRALKPWSEAAYAKQLSYIYSSVMQHGGSSPPDKAVLLSLYLVPEGFHGVGI